MQSQNQAAPGNARHAAEQILTEWMDTGAFPDRLLEAEAGTKPFTTELVYGVVRNHRALRWFISHMTKKPPAIPLVALLEAGLYQLLFMDNTESFAVVNETVESAKRVGGPPAGRLVNAILRRTLREKDDLLAELEKEPWPVRLSHPGPLVKRWITQFGEAETEALCRWNNEKPQLVLRIATGKISVAEYLKTTDSVVAHPNLPDTYVVVTDRTPVTKLPGLAEGLFYVCDPSTQVAVDLLNPVRGEKILDACAAPGGKTIAISEQLGSAGTCLALEKNSGRAKRLKANLDRMQTENVKVIRTDATRWQPKDGDLFDGILLDVPCSNTGVIRRRPDARWQFSAERIEDVTQQQRALLDHAAKWVKPGGRIVYSTCSLEPEENSEQVANWLKDHPNFTDGGQVLKVPPGSGCDGAFAARLNFVAPD